MAQTPQRLEVKPSAQVKEMEGERVTVPQPRDNHEQGRVRMRGPTPVDEAQLAGLLHGIQAVLQQIRKLADCQPKAMRTR